MISRIERRHACCRSREQPFPGGFCQLPVPRSLPWPRFPLPRLPNRTHGFSASSFPSGSRLRPRKAPGLRRKARRTVVIRQSAVRKLHTLPVSALRFRQSHRRSRIVACAPMPASAGIKHFAYPDSIRSVYSTMSSEYSRPQSLHVSSPGRRQMLLTPALLGRVPVQAPFPVGL